MNDLAAPLSGAQLVAGFSRLDSSAVSDALDALGLQPGQSGFDPVWDAPPIAGFAVTVELEPHVPEAPGAHLGTTAVASAQDTDVLVVPTEHAAEVASAAQRIEGTEAGIVQLVRGGSTLADARARTGYHDLQARRD